MVKFLFKAISFGMALTFQTAFALEAGPSGGNGGNTFTDAINLGEVVSKVAIRGAGTVDSVEAFYGPSGRSAGHHGGYGGTETSLVMQAAIPATNTTAYVPPETVTHVFGYVGTISSRFVVSKIYISTSRGRSISVGSVPQGARYFHYNIPEHAQFTGFKGSSATWLDAIGILWVTKLLP